MTSRAPVDDKLDEVLAEIEAARREPSWDTEEPISRRRMLRPPQALDEGRWVPSRAAIALIVVCAVLAVGIFAARVLMSSGSESAVAPSVSGAVRVSGSAPPQGGQLPTSMGSASAKPAGQWRIHVIGAVKRPGVVTVPAESRVSDAVSAAGGLAATADSGGVNLARKLTDGEQVHVPKPGEKWSPPADAGSSVPPAGGGQAPGSVAAGGSAGTVNLNTATLEQLDSLPGVGPVMAQRILDWRQEHGKFSTVEELGEVSGIGEKTLAKLKPKISV